MLKSKSTEKSAKIFRNVEEYMEKIYKAMKSAGSWNLALGIILIVAGCVTGIMLIVSGAKLLRKKKDLLF